MATKQDECQKVALVVAAQKLSPMTDIGASFNTGITSLTVHLSKVIPDHVSGWNRKIKKGKNYPERKTGCREKEEEKKKNLQDSSETEEGKVPRANQ
ncbi:hypothetical protein E2C01_000763 [Portunus trituberculatus]|uniref:Uncharacterized protein n=1 Tax=Portunus trituberculatus TaxID=210409 RepID=A0A5B7CIH3_PORTR|nr:hypothetical protein [Portunus trituberculatus]